MVLPCNDETGEINFTKFSGRRTIMNKIIYSFMAGILAISIVLLFPRTLVVVLIMFILGLLVIR